MNNLFVQILLFGALFSFLAIGFLYQKKPKNIKEYALGGNNIGLFALISTVIATAFGGRSIIGTSAALYQQGIWLCLVMCVRPIGMCLMSLLIVPKLSKYYGCFSVSEVIGRMYGKYAQKLGGITSFTFCIGMLAAQIKSLHWVMEHIFEQNALSATIIALAIMILYSSIGGVVSVIKTDILQLLIFIIIVPAVSYHVIHISGGVTAIIESLPETKRILVPDGSIWMMISLISLYLLPDINPWMIHRILIGRSRKKNQTTIYLLAFVSLLNLIFVSSVAFIAISKFPNAIPKETIFIVVRNIIKSKLIISSFAIALIAMIMSTADSVINTGAIVFINDVIDQKTTDKKKIKLLQYITVSSGIIATIIAFLFSTVLDIIWFFSECYFIVMLMPFVIGLFLKKTEDLAFWASTCVGIFLFCTLRIAYYKLNHEIFLISIIGGLCAYLITSLIYINRT
ncbi:MAG: sodium:solute symporter family protein [Rickettsiales bacterium]|nr:sodium:solute symporter family protein [Rickettsiales bacterium]